MTKWDDNLLEWEKIFVNYMTEKRLIYKIYKQMTQLNFKNQIIEFKMGRRLEQTFL